MTGEAMIGNLRSKRDRRLRAAASRPRPLASGRAGPLAIDATRRRLVAAEALAARMAHLAQHDALTGLPNRLLLFDRLQQALRGPRGASGRLALLFIDLDRFKAVNDEHGHATGDALLREVARRLAERVRGSDTVCRVGGDEFVVLLTPVVDRAAAAEVGAELAASLARPCRVDGRELALSASIGLALAPDDGTSAEALLARADARMFETRRGRPEAVPQRPLNLGGRFSMKARAPSR
jgi:diguanylate cyclase (GGDEF)-like protein